MRVWNVNPKIMCRKHLLGEHVEVHMFKGAISKGTSMKGYIDKGLLEIHNLSKRHEELADEMVRRGYKHNSPFNISSELVSGKINENENKMLLSIRCPKCRRMQNENNC